MRWIGFLLVPAVLLLALVPVLRARRKVRDTGPLRGRPGPGGGVVRYMRVPPTRRGSSTMAANLWPWIVGAAIPDVGVPVGRTLNPDAAQATVRFDPISWFTAKIIAKPSVFILGNPGLGKSSFVRRMLIVLAAWGVIPVILGDKKGEYVELVRALNGQVITLGRGRGYLNVLDMGDTWWAAEKIGGTQGSLLLADARFRRQSGVESLMSLERGTALESHETTLLGVSLTILDELYPLDVEAPLLTDLLEIVNPTALDKDGVVLLPDPRLRVAVQDRGHIDSYWADTKKFIQALSGLCDPTGMGAIFAQPTTTQMVRDRAVVFDLSGVSDDDTKVQAALQFACWSLGFGQIAVNQALARAGHAKKHRYQIVMDELWSALRESPGSAGRVDSLGRLNRGTKTRAGVGVIYVSHTMKDAESLPTESDRTIAKGLVERSGAIVCFGLPSSEMVRLDTVGRWSDSAKRLLVKWGTPPRGATVPVKRKTGPRGEGTTIQTKAPGVGFFLIHVGEAFDIPGEMTWVEDEATLSDTSSDWEEMGDAA